MQWLTKSMNSMECHTTDYVKLGLYEYGPFMQTDRDTYHLAIVIVWCDSLTQQKNFGDIQVHPTAVTERAAQREMLMSLCEHHHQTSWYQNPASEETCAITRMLIVIGVVRCELKTVVPLHKIPSYIYRISSDGQRVVGRRIIDRVGFTTGHMGQLPRVPPIPLNWVALPRGQRNWLVWNCWFF